MKLIIAIQFALFIFALIFGLIWASNHDSNARLGMDVCRYAIWFLFLLGLVLYLGGNL